MHKAKLEFYAGIHTDNNESVDDLMVKRQLLEILVKEICGDLPIALRDLLTIARKYAPATALQRIELIEQPIEKHTEPA